MPAGQCTTNRIEDSNSVLQVRDENLGNLAVKQYRRKPFNAKMLKYWLLHLIGKDIPVEYRSAAERRDFEACCLELWRNRGFSVPAMAAVPEHLQPQGIFLGLELIEGERLDHFLGASDTDPERKMDVLHQIFLEMRARHCVAIFEARHSLIHFDANARNVIIQAQTGRIVRLDFEMGREDEDIDKSAAREVLKLTLQMANLMGRERLEAIVQRLVADYGIVHVLKRVQKEVRDIALASFHLRRDRRRKEKKPGLVTKFDVAEAIANRLGAQAAAGGTKSGSDARDDHLAKALETSWNGKFYQSLDDSDIRGRDMRHRYAVMQFPDNFTNLSVLDIGCNIGRICMDAVKRGARRAVGIDNRPDVVDAMNHYYQQAGIGVQLHTFDINRGCRALIDQIGPEPFDYVYALSIWSHVDPEKFWEIINHFCAGVLILEDNAPSRIKSLSGIEEILRKRLPGRTTEFLGFTTDRGVRAVYRLSHD